MALVQQSYTPTPVSDKSTLPTTPSPDGTIYMFGYSYELEQGKAPACEPVGYWRDPETLLRWCCKDFDSGIAPVYQDTFNTVGKSCDVYLIHNRLGDDLYIYVWAIQPATGGAA